MTKIRDFDSAAHTWDEEPRRVKLATEIAAAVKNRLALSNQWHALDVGCGTGLVTLALAPHLAAITGIDSSCGMLDKLAEKIKASGISNVKTSLHDPAAGELPGGKYHLIVSAMMLHHIEKPEQLLLNLKTLLHPGAWIAMADLAAEDGSFHEDPSGVFHHGFSGDELTAILDKAGFTNISVSEATSITKGERIYPVLLVVAQA
jgi:2-polyprenyl-3-methyl-5-hydroxy-6-metoxy-1,4-benzoquinol methylase